MEIYERPSFVCFTTEMKNESGEGHVGVTVRIEDMHLTDEQVIAIKEIQESAAEKVYKLLLA